MATRRATPTNARIVKFDKSGKFIKAWGKLGTAPGQFEGPHVLAIRFARPPVRRRPHATTACRSSIRKASSSPAWNQFGRPSGIFIDKNDMLYVADSESRDEDGYGHNPG